MDEYWAVRYWRTFPTARNAKLAFIGINDEDRRKVPEDLMTAIIAELKKQVDYDTATIKDYEKREYDLHEAISSRPEGATITSVYQRLSEEWGIDEESVKKLHNRIKKRRRGHNLLK